MSKKKDRAWFTCRRWADLVSAHYANDADAGRVLNTDPKVLAKLRSGMPLPKSTILRILRRHAGLYPLPASAAELVDDMR